MTHDAEPDSQFQGQYLEVGTHRIVKTHFQSIPYQCMADRHLKNFWDPTELAEILQVQIMAGIYAEPDRLCRPQHTRAGFQYPVRSSIMPLCLGLRLALSWKISIVIMAAITCKQPDSRNHGYKLLLIFLADHLNGIAA
jgi:hypothetical protein